MPFNSAFAVICAAASPPLTDPQAFGEPLRGELAGVWRHRMGDYRLLCRIERSQQTVLVIRIGHRRSVYD